MELPQATLPSLPIELLWEIAKKSPSAFFAMATAIPCIGRESFLPHIQAKMKAHFTVKHEYKDKYTIWILPNGLPHSNYDAPAILANGSKYWYKNGIIHRDDDKPAMIIPNDTMQWYVNGKLYRDNDNPTIITLTLQIWSKYDEIRKKDVLHRDGDKPAKIQSDGRCEFWKNGIQYTPKMNLM